VTPLGRVMRKFASRDDWAPIGVKALEANALTAVRSEANALVVAGPGAGKTELLAQRACYLLQTGICSPPRQILAISFKKDAAANLQERVRRRCGEALARRFHSLTFDAFSKSLIDRFSRALPEEYRPTPDYVINFDIQKRCLDYLKNLTSDTNGLTIQDVSGLSTDQFYKRVFLGRALPISIAKPLSVENRAASVLWSYLLKGKSTSHLDFNMIGRLAELLVRLNPLLSKALRLTYSHIFLDEFQDTTQIQYALTRTLFQNCSVVLTAVGDSKQRIMSYAGALDRIFEVFHDDFQAEIHGLVMNYRSAPKLVRMQEILIAAIEPGSVVPKAADDGKDGDGECRILLYPSHEREATHLAQMAVGWIHEENLKPRDICILTRNKPGDYTGKLIQDFAAGGVKARVETDLQDLLVEPLVLVLMDALTLAVHGKNRSAWTSLVSLIRGLRGLDEADPRVRQVEQTTKAKCVAIGAALTSPECDLKSLRKQLAEFLDFIGFDAFRRLYPQYVQGNYTKERFCDFTDKLWTYFQAAGNWPQAISDMIGEDTVPIITVHKSKGLEYHSVVFLGLEDSAFWTFANQSDEEKRAFFVAFSRAKKRVLFTFCERRAKGNGRPEAQSRKNIGVLYELLASAGVEEIRIE
jgi:DNA helicase II / ATP-dependent DNA helicase PcrA